MLGPRSVEELASGKGFEWFSGYVQPGPGGFSIPTGFTIRPSADVLIFSQFTGLLDKNGKEIYEGDILESPSRGRRTIDWEDSEASFIVEGTYPNRMANDGEVIGNIYENPDLVPKKI